MGFTVSGTAGLSVDVATGNAEFTDQLVTLPGVNSDVSVALAWNSSVVGTSLPSAVTGGTGTGWVITGFDQRLIGNADGSVTYYGPGGLTGVFTPSGSAYTSPSQFQGTLASKTGGGWTLTMHGSQNVLTFTASVSDCLCKNRFRPVSSHYQRSGHIGNRPGKYTSRVFRASAQPWVPVPDSPPRLLLMFRKPR